MDLHLDGATVYLGDCVQRMREMADGSAQMCVTSPPYFGLRDYGHDGQIGLEETPEAFIAKLVEVFREVRRVLTDDGTLWVNIGDSYCSTAPGTRNAPQTKGSTANPEQWANARPKTPDGMKPKDLIGIPWMLAFALRADGWYLRSEIIWHKPNPMPESVTDRPTKAHEQLFLLSKRPKYFYDMEAVREPVAESQRGRVRADPVGGASHVERGQHSKGGVYTTGRRKADSFKRDNSKREQAIPGQNYGTHRPDRNESNYDTETRNRRSVWSINTKPFKGAHFAVFPPALVEPCILAGSRPGDLVLDPFNGSGTTGQVALEHGRRYVGCELNAEYIALTGARLSGVIAAKAALKAAAVELAAQPVQLDLLTA